MINIYIYIRKLKDTKYCLSIFTNKKMIYNSKYKYKYKNEILIRNNIFMK